MSVVPVTNKGREGGCQQVDALHVVEVADVAHDRPSGRQPEDLTGARLVAAGELAVFDDVGEDGDPLLGDAQLQQLGALILAADDVPFAEPRAHTSEQAVVHQPQRQTALQGVRPAQGSEYLLGVGQMALEADQHRRLRGAADEVRYPAERGRGNRHMNDVRLLGRVDDARHRVQHGAGAGQQVLGSGVDLVQRLPPQLAGVKGGHQRHLMTAALQSASQACQTVDLPA